MLTMISRKLGDFLKAREFAETFSVPEDLAPSLFDIDVVEKDREVNARLRDNEIYQDHCRIAETHKKQYDERMNPQTNPETKQEDTLETRPKPSMISDSIIQVLDTPVDSDYLRLLAIIKSNMVDSIDCIMGSVRLLNTGSQTLQSVFYRPLLIEAFQNFRKLTKAFIEELGSAEEEANLIFDFINAGGNPATHVNYSHDFSFDGMLREVFQPWSVKKVFRAVVLAALQEGGWIRCRKILKKGETLFKVDFKDLKLYSDELYISNDPDEEGIRNPRLLSERLDGKPQSVFGRRLFMMLKDWAEGLKEDMGGLVIKDPTLAREFDMRHHFSQLFNLTLFSDALNSKAVFKEGIQPDSKREEHFTIKLTAEQLEVLLVAEQTVKPLTEGYASLADIDEACCSQWLVLNCLSESYVPLSLVAFHRYGSVLDCCLTDPWRPLVSSRILEINCKELTLEIERELEKKAEDSRYQFCVRSLKIAKMLESEIGVELTGSKEIWRESQNILQLLEEREVVYKTIDDLVRDMAILLSNDEMGKSVTDLGVPIFDVQLDETSNKYHIIELLVFIFLSNLFTEKTERQLLRFVTKPSPIDTSQGLHDDQMIHIVRPMLEQLKEDISLIPSEEIRLDPLPKHEQFTLIFTCSSHLKSLKMQDFWKRVVDNMIELCDQVITPDTVAGLKDEIYTIANRTMNKLNTERKNLEVHELQRLSIDDKGYPTLPQDVRMKWHPIRRFKPEHKDNDCVVSHRIWLKLWPFIAEAHWKVNFILPGSSGICDLVRSNGEWS